MTATRQLQVTALAVVSVALDVTIPLIQAFRQLPLGYLHPAALAALALCIIGLLAAYVFVGIAR